MAFLIGSALAATLVTLVAARFVVRRWPDAGYGTQLFGAAMSFPLLAVLLFVVATTVALVGASDAPAHQGAGMAVFAMVFFLVYAIVVGAVVGIPTAIVAVRRFRRR